MGGWIAKPEPAGSSLGGLSQYYLLVSFGAHASRPSKTAGDVRSSLLDSLWWGVPAPPLLQPPPAPATVDSGSLAAPAQSPVQCRRDVPGAGVPDDPRAGTDRHDAAA